MREKEKNHTQVWRCKSTKNNYNNNNNYYYYSYYYYIYYKLLLSETAVKEKIRASRNLYFHTIPRPLGLHSHQYQGGVGTVN